MTKGTPHVTDHALIRYLERIRGFKFDREVAEIRRICAAVQNGRVKAHGCLFVVKDGYVITVNPDSGSPNRTQREEVKRLT